MSFKHSLEGGVERLLRGLYIYVPAILEDIDDENLGVVVKKDDKDVTQDKVPLFSLYSGDGFGEKHAMHPPEEGFMLAPKYPIPEVMSKPGVLESVSHSRHYSFKDGVFIAGPRFHGFEAPMEAPMEAYLYRHKSGAERYISPSGDMRFSHPDGHEVSLSTDTVEVTFKRSDGEEMSLIVNQNQALFSGPDTTNDFAQNPQVQMGVSSDGSGQLDGRIDVGDSDAHRYDPQQLNTDPEDPKTYAEVDVPADPMQDPSKASSQYENPDSVTMEGPVDSGFYELRRHVVERREQDPDPAVTDPTQPGYVEMPDEMRQTGKLPVGYEWINMTEGAKKIMGMDGVTPVVIKQL